MKIVLDSSKYTFDAATKTIDFTPFAEFDQSRLYAVINTTSEQKLIFAVASYASGLGGSFSGSVLTLSYDTTSMSNSDLLQIIYDDPAFVQNTSTVQSGTWNINNVSGSISLPTGAATEASLSSLDSKVTTVDTSNVSITSSIPSGSNTIGKVDVNGTVPVSAASLPLPSGAATEATLASLDGKVTTVDTSNVTITSSLPAGSNVIGSVDINSGTVSATFLAEGATGSPLPTEAIYVAGNDSGTLTGIKVSSTGVVSVDGSSVTQPISASSLPLPLNAATETTVSSIDGKLSTTPNGLRVDAVGTVDIGSSALPLNAATETTLSSIDGKISTTPNGIRVDAVGTIDIGSSALPLNAATETTLSSLDGKITTTPNGVRVDAIVSSGQIDSYLHDGSGNAITSTASALDVNIASGSITASNPSVSATGSAVPAQATFVGGKDGSGNLIAVAVDSNGVVSENVKTIEGVDDTGNSSSTPLGSNAVFTGTWINITNYTAISLGIYADQASATDGLVAQYSYDGVTVHHEHKYTYSTPSIGIGYNLTSEFKYYRIKYTNGSVAQTDFKLQSILKATTLSPSMYKITNTLTDNSQAIVTRSVITGVTTGGGGGYVNVKVNPSGSLVADVTGTVAATQSGTWDINNVSGTVSLPTGAATSANQTTANSSLSSIDGKLTSVTVGTLPSLPAGSNTIGAISNASFGISGTLPAFASTPTVNLGTIGTAATAANQTAVQSTVGVSSGTAITVQGALGGVALPVDAYILNSSINTTTSQLPGFLGETTKNYSLSVTMATDSSPLNVKSVITNSKGQFVRNDYTSTSVTTSAYTQLIASTSAAYSAIEIFDSSGQTLKLAIGGAGAEVDQFIIFPGGNGRIPFTIASGSRISIRALSDNANSGEIDINLYV